ncbi:MAG: hypothetical protein WC509_03350 [Candidatus Izemoplasmatales bacterium]
MNFSTYREMYGKNAGLEFVAFRHHDLELEIMVKDYNVIVKAIINPESSFPKCKDYPFEEILYMIMFIDQIFRELKIYDPDHPVNR